MPWGFLAKGERVRVHIRNIERNGQGFWNLVSLHPLPPLAGAKLERGKGKYERLQRAYGRPGRFAAYAARRHALTRLPLIVADSQTWSRRLDEGFLLEGAGGVEGMFLPGRALRGSFYTTQH